MRPWIDEGRMPTPDEMRADRKRLRELFFVSSRKAPLAKDYEPQKPVEIIGQKRGKKTIFGPYMTRDFALTLIAKGRRGRKATTVRQVLEMCSMHFNLSPQVILSKRRNRDIARVRQIVAYICVAHIGLSLTNTGRLMGGLDHTTVLHAKRKIETAVTNDPKTHQEVNKVLHFLGLDPLMEPEPKNHSVKNEEASLAVKEKAWAMQVIRVRDAVNAAFGVCIEGTTGQWQVSEEETLARYAGVFLCTPLNVPNVRVLKHFGYAKANYGDTLARTIKRMIRDPEFAGKVMSISRELYRD